MYRVLTYLGFAGIFAWYSQYQYQPGTWGSFLSVGEYYGYPMPAILWVIEAGEFLGSVDWFILSLSGLAYAWTIVLFYRTFDLSPRLWHVPLFIPLAAIMAVKSNHFLTPLFFIGAAYLFKGGRFWASALIASLAYWFRSELILMPLFFGVLTFRKQFIFIPLAFVTVWFSITGQPGTSNNSAVLFISQFSYPNPWRIEYKDEVALELAEKSGESHAWRAETQAFFFRQTLRLIREHPLYFAGATPMRAGRVFYSRLYVAKDQFGGLVSTVLVAGLLLFLWYPVFQNKRLGQFELFVVSFALCQVIISAGAGTMQTNATYLFLLGNAARHYA